VRIGVKRLSFEYDGIETWVDVTKPTLDELMSFVKDYGDGDNPGKALNACHSFLEKHVVAWDFEDVEGKALPVNGKSIKRLPVDLTLAIIKKVQEECVELPLAKLRSSTGQSSSET